MIKVRLDNLLASRSLVASRSQAESYIKLGSVKVGDKIIKKPGFYVSHDSEITISVAEQYVGRAGLKLASVADQFNLDFRDKQILDVGSSTGGFTDFSLRRGAKKVIAIDVGTEQMHPSLRQNPKLELHEKTDIRDWVSQSLVDDNRPTFDIVLIDVSFISLREILPYIAKLSSPRTQIVAMCKPQFELGSQSSSSGVVKNDTIRRQIIKNFELWLKPNFIIANKADSKIAGAKGNIERFYLLKISKK